MTATKTKLKIGIVGCGAIGSRLAKAVVVNFGDKAELSGIYDVILEKAHNLASELKINNIVVSTLDDLIKRCDFVIESASAKSSKSIAKSVVEAGKDILVMSVGGMLEAQDVFKLAKDKSCHIYFPSGAIAGLDAIKAASFSNINNITITTRKPPSGLKGNEYLLKNNFDLDHIQKETIVFEGSVDKAVELFPQNINVAATLSLASGCKDKIKVKIVTSPEYKRNSHEIIAEGDFGAIKTCTDNLPCPDNPKTSFLAVLSATAMLKNILEPVKIGT